MKRQKEKIGDIVKISFDGEYFTYAQVLLDGVYVFYNLKLTKEIYDLKKIISSPKLFSIIVHASAVQTGFWKVIGNLPLPENHVNPLFFKNKITPKGSQPEYEIYQDGKTRDANRKECIGLEYFFIWTREQVEERLRDYYSGKPNFQAEYYRLTE